MDMEETKGADNSRIVYIVIGIGVIIVIAIIFYQVWKAKDHKEYSSIVQAAGRQLEVGSAQPALDMLEHAMNRWSEYSNTDALAHRLCGLSLFLLNRRAEAIPEFEKSITLGDDTPATSGHLIARSYLLNGDTLRALAQYTKILSEDSYRRDKIFTPPQIMLARAEIYESLGKDSLALIDLDSVISSAHASKQNDYVTAADNIRNRIFIKNNTHRVNLKIERFITPGGVPIEGTMMYSIVILGTVIDMGECYQQDFRRLANNYKIAKITATQIRKHDGKGYEYQNVQFMVPSKMIDEGIPSFESNQSPF